MATDHAISRALNNLRRSPWSEALRDMLDADIVSARATYENNPATEFNRGVLAKAEAIRARLFTQPV